MHVQQRSADEELLPAEAGDDVLDRQLELIDGEVAAAIEADERAAGADELVDRAHARLVGRGQVLGRRLASACRPECAAGARTRRPPAVRQRRGRRVPPSLEHTRVVGEHQHVDLVAQRSGLHVGAGDARVLELVLIEHPARPALVHARVAEQQPDARPLGLHAGRRGGMLGAERERLDELGLRRAPTGRRSRSGRRRRRARHDTRPIRRHARRD